MNGGWIDIVLFLNFRIERMNIGAFLAVFWDCTTLVGLSLAGILPIYPGTSIASVFFISAGSFAAMSLYGYAACRNPSQFGSFVSMGMVPSREIDVVGNARADRTLVS